MLDKNYHSEQFEKKNHIMILFAAKWDATRGAIPNKNQRSLSCHMVDEERDVVHNAAKLDTIATTSSKDPSLCKLIRSHLK